MPDAPQNDARCPCCGARPKAPKTTAAFKRALDNWRWTEAMAKAMQSR